MTKIEAAKKIIEGEGKCGGILCHECPLYVSNKCEVSEWDSMRYPAVVRNARFPMMEAFDMPDTHESCARRNVTITAPQALALLNDEQTIEWARAFAGRILDVAGDDRLRQVEQAYLLAYNRTPDGFEKDAALTFFEKQREVIVKRQTASEPLALPEADLSAVDPAAAAALVDFCHALMNSNEFVYVH